MKPKVSFGAAHLYRQPNGSARLVFAVVFLHFDSVRAAVVYPAAEPDSGDESKVRCG